jgi:hypothetical protein
MTEQKTFKEMEKLSDEDLMMTFIRLERNLEEPNRYGVTYRKLFRELRRRGIFKPTYEIFETLYPNHSFSPSSLFHYSQRLWR